MKVDSQEPDKRTRVLCDVTNTCKRGRQPLVPGKFLIGNDKIRKQDVAGVSLEDPASKKRVIGELVNVNKGKQRLHWTMEGMKLSSFATNTEIEDQGGHLKQGPSNGSSSPSSAAVLEDDLGNSAVIEDEDGLRRSSMACDPFPLDLFPSKGDSSSNPEIISDRKEQTDVEFVNLAEKSSQCSGKESRNSLRDLNKEAYVSENCSCSFCLKARHIWADLLYQDCKGRLFEVNKTKKGAKVYMGSSQSLDIERKEGVRNEKHQRLDSDLEQLWRALFVHTESLLTCESAQLQSDLLRLKELRESSKRDAETDPNIQNAQEKGRHVIRWRRK
ncbi:uncharacterized protein LOC144711079 [Wolffia australiana]